MRRMGTIQSIAVFAALVIDRTDDGFHAFIPIADVHGHAPTETEAVDRCVAAFVLKNAETYHQRGVREEE